MRFLFLIPTVFSLLFTTFPFAAPQEITQESPQILITARILNVRDAPQGKKLDRVFRGQQFQIFDEKQGWGKIEFRPTQEGWISLQYTKKVKSSRQPKQKIANFCQSLNQDFQKQGWTDIQCNPQDWRANHISPQGNPLIYTILGNEPSTTMMICTVHGDEYSTYHCFRFLQQLQKHSEDLTQRLIIIPVANPDGFFSQPKTRTNARNVDLNRNLPTRDWDALALRQWKDRYQKNPRRFPGTTANSEPENQFLLQMILTYEPEKIISLHSPLDFLDLDYMDRLEGGEKELQIRREAWNLAMKFTEKTGTRFRDYHTFPGSLGRFGNEWKIPIYTLELPNSSSNQSPTHFKRIANNMLEFVNFTFERLPSVTSGSSFITPAANQP